MIINKSTDGDFQCLSCLYRFSVRWPRHGLMNVELASHLSRDLLSKKPDTCSLRSEEHHQRFYPGDISRETLSSDWSVWTIPGLWLVKRMEIVNRSPVIIYTHLRHSRVRFPLHKPSLSLSTLTIPLLQKCRAAFSFYESFFNENDRASNWRNSVGPKH